MNLLQAKCVGRLAPSPTGALHVGNARSFLLAWLLCRQQSDNCLVLRFDDLETPRVKPWAVNQVYEDLRWLGLDWDASPQCPLTGGPLLTQSERHARYREILDRLLTAELVYPCTCTRSQIASLSDDAAAPHETQLDGHVYQNTCRHRKSSDCEDLQRRGTKYCLRFRWDETFAVWHDRFYGEQQINPRQMLGDFVVWRTENAAAYQLSTVVDDHDIGINQVVRGSDLIYSTFRQLAIFQALGWQPPQYIHLPLVVGIDGKRLAKRHGDSRLATLRQAGIRAEQLIAYLALQSNWTSAATALNCRDLLSIDLLKNLKHEPLIFEISKAIEEMKSIT